MPADTEGEADGHESDGKEDKRSRGARTRAKVCSAGPSLSARVVLTDR